MSGVWSPIEPDEPVPPVSRHSGNAPPYLLGVGMFSLELRVDVWQLLHRRLGVKGEEPSSDLLKRVLMNPRDPSQTSSRHVIDSGHQ